MKKLLFFFFCLTVAVAANAQDIIVKKNGSTIKAKVQRVTTTEVKYKDYFNPNGAVKSINISELLSVNYEDGGKETFGNVKNSQSIVTNETATKFSNDRELVDIYNKMNGYPDYNKKAKVLKSIGIIGGLVAIGVGIGMMSSDSFESESDYESNDINVYGGGAMIGIGVIGGITCYLIGNKYKRMANQLYYTSSLWNTEINLKNGNSLNLGIDALSDNTSYNKSLGVGLRYNF